MKKTLSIILSLLMVLSTVTCMFTMPTSAEEAASTTTVETLPVNDFISNNGEKILKPDSAWTIAGTEYKGAVNFGIRGWEGVARKGADGKNYNALIDADGNYVYEETEANITNNVADYYKHDAAGNYYGKNGNIVKDPYDSRVNSNVVYQMTFDVTVSEDATEGAKFFVDFFSQATPQNLNVLVGVRNDKTTPTSVETAYNYVSSVKNGKAGTPNSTAANAAVIEAGKTYTYTYIFNTSSTFVNHIAAFVDGLTEGNVKINNAKIFPLNETDAGNFVFQKGAITYAVEENGNVYTRMYGYRAVGVNTIVGANQQVSAKLGGDLYNIMLKGGETYNLDFDMRATTVGVKEDGTDFVAGYSPSFDFYETGVLDYSAEYDEIKAEGDTQNYIYQSTGSTVQRTYSAPNVGYSYFYANANSATKNRRIGAKGNAIFTDANGVKLWEGSEGGSLQGRMAKSAVNNKGWVNTTYTLEALGAQTIEQAAKAGASSNNNKYMRYTYDTTTNELVFNSTYNNWYVPAKQDVTVAFGLDYIYDGCVYDFDNFSLTTKGKEVPVEYKNAKGETDTLANTAHNAEVYTDVFADKTYATINLFESDTVIFNGWYNGDEFVSTDAKLEINGTYDNLKAVFTSKNILTYAGGFENYAANTNLEADYTLINTTNYPNYTGAANDSRRFYNSLPKADKWTGWDSNVKLNSSFTDSDNGATVAQIKADIEAAGGVFNNYGFSGFTHFAKFPTVVKGTQSVKTFGDSGQAYGVTYVPVAPYSGENMLRLQASTRTGFRAIEGLTAGKTYTLSFYAYNTYAYYFLKDVYVTDAPMLKAHVSSVNLLASYVTPHDTVSEDVRDKDGNVTGPVSNINKAKADYVQKWYKIELTFTANAETAYLGISNQHKSYTSGYTFIDELTLVEYDCKGNHRYDDLLDTDCNVCGEARSYPSAWDFEDGSMENITVSGNSTIKVVDAKDQAEKIGSKYLEYTSAGFHGMVINFMYEQGYKYKISYDFKIFAYGTGKTSNGIDHAMTKYDDGKYGVATGGPGYLAPYNENVVTRYWEDGTIVDKITCFTHEGGNNFYGRQSKDGAYIDAMSAHFGDTAIWNEWQHFEIEVGNAGDYEGFVEFGIRPNDVGWVIGLDNFTVEKIATATIDEADEATNGTYAFNIRARTADQKQGLRFKSTIDLDALNLEDGAKIVEYGTLAYKAEYADQGYFLRRETAKDITKNGKAIAGVAYSSEDGIDVRYALDENTNELTYTGVLTGIGVKNYDVDFMVCGYAIVETADGKRITVYDDAVTLSVLDAAQQIVAESTEANDVAIAQTVIDTYNAYVAAQ